MFERIPFTHTETEIPLTSQKVDRDHLTEGPYDPENILNSEFRIVGSVDGFLRPPISDFAKQNLFHMQAFSIFSYKKGSFTKRHKYPSFLLLYTYEGSARLEYMGKKSVLNPFDGCLIDCRCPHIYTALTDWKVAVLHFDGPLASHMYEELVKTGSVLFHEPVTGHFHQMLEELLNIYNSPSLQRDLRAAHRIEGMLLHVLVSASNIALVKGEVPFSVQKAMKYMEDHYTEAISLEDLAGFTFTDKYRLSREFKRYTGFSPYDYLLRLRINQARILLKTTTLPVVKIAHMVGIHDINNFNYLFKKRMQATPTAYRISPDFIP